ncbi:hypothetical protein FOMPIDRAFT_1047767 [Fomitopsis schrenkii]|uniref:Uncharacterized protein n=1 Tax=Fomitopsis schrenkii TaxID=2126942 RepID=S8EBR1_FOMSC|nr:hypothetical protein FOMPIDRAFT_1047767 [Fomitopsis schrenkii]
MSGVSGLSVRCFLPLEAMHEDNSDFDTDDDDDDDGPVVHFSCHIEGTQAHLHAQVRPSHALYNLGCEALGGPTDNKMFRSVEAGRPWCLLTSHSVQTILKEPARSKP